MAPFERLPGSEVAAIGDVIIGQEGGRNEFVQRKCRMLGREKNQSCSSRSSGAASEPPNGTFENPKRSRRLSVARAKRSSLSRRPGSRRSIWPEPAVNDENSTPTRRRFAVPFHALEKRSRTVRRKIVSRSEGSVSVWLRVIVVKLA